MNKLKGFTNKFNNYKKILKTTFWLEVLYSYFYIFLILSIISWSKHTLTDKGVFISSVCFGAIFSFVFGGLIIFFLLFGFNLQKEKLFVISYFLSVIPIVNLIFCYITNKIFTKKLKIGKSESLSAYSILFLLSFAIILVIWILFIFNILPSDATIPGILDGFLSPIYGFADAAQLIVFLLIIGGFLQLVNSSLALEAGITSLTKKIKGKEIWLIPILMLLFSIGGTTFGMCEETIPFYLILMPVLLAGGFDKITTLFVILFGAGLGVAGSTINPFLISVAVESSQVPGLTVSTGIGWRLIVYFALVISGITYVTYRAYKIKNDPKKSIVYNSMKEDLKTFKIDLKNTVQFTTKRKIILFVFLFTFAVMILGVIDWQSLTGFSGFVWFHDQLAKCFPFISSLNPIGQWSTVEMSFVFLVSSFIVGALTWKNEKEFINNFFTGAKDFLGVGFIIAIARGLSKLLENSKTSQILVDQITNMASSMNHILFSIVLFLIFGLLSVFIISTSGLASLAFPTVGPALTNAGLSVSASITSFSLASGFINLSSPSAGPFVASCSLSKIELNTYYKASWKFLTFIGILSLSLVIVSQLVSFS